MINSYSRKKKYTSLAVSLLFHIAIVLLLYYASYTVKNFSTHDSTSDTSDSTPRRATPAPVSFAGPTPAQPSQPIHAQTQGSPLATPQIVDDSTHTNIVEEPEEPALVQAQEPLETAQDIMQEATTEEASSPDSSTDKNIQEEQATTEQPEPAVMLPITRSGSTSDNYAHTAFTAATVARRGQTQTRRRRSHINGAQLLQALRSSYNAERAQQTSQVTSQATGKSGVPAHVQERLNSWKYASYDTRMADALYDSFNRISTVQTFAQSIHKFIDMLITVDQTGKVITCVFKEPTDNPSMDNYIIAGVKKAKFAPIPKQLNCSQYTFPFKAYVNISPGTGRLIFSKGR